MTQRHRSLTRRTVLVLACTSPLISACAAGSGAGRDAAQGGAPVEAAKGEIRWMSRAPSEANPTFEKQNPGAKLLADWPAGNFQEKLTAAIAGGDPPDLAFIAASQFQVLAAQKQVAPLDSYIKRDGSLKKDDMYPIWLKGLQFNGQQAAMPFDPSVLMLYHNRAIFDRLQIPRLDPTKPLVWEDVLELARRLTLDQNGVDATRGSFDPNAVKQAGIQVQAQYFWWFLPRQNGQEFYTPDLSSVTLNQPAAGRLGAQPGRRLASGQVPRGPGSASGDDARRKRPAPAPLDGERPLLPRGRAAAQQGRGGEGNGDGDDAALLPAQHRPPADGHPGTGWRLPWGRVTGRDDRAPHPAPER